MIVTLTTAQMRELGEKFLRSWEKEKNSIKMSGKNLHSLVGLKKTLEAKTQEVEETLSLLALRFEGEPQEDGRIIIPEDQRVAAGEAFLDFSKETLQIEAFEIILKEDDYLPIEIMDAIFQFIKFE